MRRSSFITWEQLKVVAVVAVAALILGVTVYRLGKATNLFEKHYRLIAIIGDGDGLREGAQVMIAGRLAGSLERMEFLPVSADTTRSLRLVLALSQGMQDHVRSNSRASIKTMGLLGDKLIDISPGAPGYPVLQNGDTIHVLPPFDTDVLFARAAGVVDQVGGLTADLRTISSAIAQGRGTLGQLVASRDLYDRITASLDHTDALIGRVQHSKGTLGQLIDDPTLYNRMVDAVGSTDSLVASLTNRQGTLGRLVNDDTLYVALLGLTQRMTEVTQSADSMMTLLKSGKGTAGRLLTDQSLYDSLNKLVTDMSDLVGDIRKDPRKYFKGLITVF